MKNTTHFTLTVETPPKGPVFDKPWFLPQDTLWYKQTPETFSVSVKIDTARGYIKSVNWWYPVIVQIQQEGGWVDTIGIKDTTTYFDSLSGRTPLTHTLYLKNVNIPGRLLTKGDSFLVFRVWARDSYGLAGSNSATLYLAPTR